MMIKKKMIKTLLAVAVIAICFGSANNVKADDPIPDPDCVNCQGVYYEERDGKCYIGGYVCMPGPKKGYLFGDFVCFSRPGGETLWTETVLHAYELLCTGDCVGFHFEGEVGCDEYIDFYILYDGWGFWDWLCGTPEKPSRIYR